MKNILVFADYYYPGIKAGGPAKSIYNLINNLSSYYNFNLVTRNRDLGEKEATIPKTEELKTNSLFS